MAKALFLSLPLRGHTNPSLPLVQELVQQGEEILYYSIPAFAAQIERTGAQYQPYRNAFLADMTHLPQRMEELSYLLMRTTAEILSQEADAFRAERPEYLITDSVAPWGQWIGELLGVPVVTSVCTFAFNRHVMSYGITRGVRPKSARVFVSKVRYIVKSLRLRRQVRSQYKLHGTDLMGMVSGQSALNIVYTSRYFQPCAETFDERHQFIGPSLAPRNENIAFPWEQVRHPGIVYISLGTLFNANAEFYQHCFEAFESEDCQVILAVGTNVSIESLGVPPPNFIVQSYVPQLEVLERAAAFVTHGGMNSVSESLSYSVPVMVIPQMGEQEIVGRRVEELGAGLFLAKSAVTPQNLRVSVQRLLAEDLFRQQAAQVCESFRSAGGTRGAAEAIRTYTRER